MSKSPEYESGKEDGLILGELRAMTRAFEEFKMGIGARVAKLEAEMANKMVIITSLKEAVDDLKKMAKWMITLVLGTLIVQAMRILFKF